MPPNSWSSVNLDFYNSIWTMQPEALAPPPLPRGHTTQPLRWSNILHILPLPHLPSPFLIQRLEVNLYSATYRSPTYSVDRSSLIDNSRNRQAVYAMVTSTDKVEVIRLMMGTSSQKAELVALTRALQIAKGPRANIYTDSKYAFLIAHTHSTLWKERGFLTTKGTPIVNGPLISQTFGGPPAPHRSSHYSLSGTSILQGCNSLGQCQG